MFLLVGFDGPSPVVEYATSLLTGWSSPMLPHPYSYPQPSSYHNSCQLKRKKKKVESRTYARRFRARVSAFSFFSVLLFLAYTQTNLLFALVGNVAVTIFSLREVFSHPVYPVVLHVPAFMALLFSTFCFRLFCSQRSVFSVACFFLFLVSFFF